MKDPKNMKTLGEERDLFLDKLTKKVESLGCKGPVEGEPSLPLVTAISLEQRNRIQIMMGMTDKAALSFKLGANPSDTHNAISLRQLTDAYAKVHGTKFHTKMIELLDEYGAEKPRRKPRATKN